MDGWTDDRGVYWRAAGDDFPNYFPYLINQRDNSIFVADRWQVHTPGIQESSAFINRYVVKWGAWFHPWQPVVIVSLTGHYTVYTPAATSDTVRCSAAGHAAAAVSLPSLQRMQWDGSVSDGKAQDVAHHDCYSLMQTTSSNMNNWYEIWFASIWSNGIQWDRLLSS